MKKLSIIMAMVAMVLAFSSCKQEDEPKYKAPTTFKVNQPALQNQVFRTAQDMTDKETFNLFCSQPDYGYSAICNYSALVSLNPDAPEEEWIVLPNEKPTSASMEIKTFELGVALNKLLNVENSADFDARGLYDEVYKCYFKAVCEIPNVEGSRIVSDNVVTYNKVMIQYAEKLPGWIFIVGDVSNIETGAACSNGKDWVEPKGSNYDLYKANWVLYEPNNMIGEKVYVGSFNLVPKSGVEPDKFNEGNPDACAQFRFFTELNGWSDPNVMWGSNEADFYCLPTTDKWLNGFEGDMVNGKGNWGVFVTEPQPITIVVDTGAKKVYFKEGLHEVEFTGHTPEFKD